MIYLTLNNGTQIEVEETSTSSSIVVKGDLTKVDSALTEITTENLKNADLNCTTLTNKVYTDFTGKREEDIYTVTFNLRDKTDMELLFEKVQDIEGGLTEVADMVYGEEA